MNIVHFFFLVGTRQSLHNLCLIEIHIKIRAATNIAKTWTNFVTKAQISISNQQIIQTNSFHTISVFFFYFSLSWADYHLPCAGVISSEAAYKIYDFRNKQNLNFVLRVVAAIRLKSI